MYEYFGNMKEECPPPLFVLTKNVRYQKTIAVTKYREIPRVFPYDETRHYQLLGLIAKGGIDFGTFKEPINFSQKSEKEGYTHNYNMPDLGLYPKQLDLPDPLAWLKEQSTAIGSEFSVAGDKLWDHLYCKPQLNDRSIASNGERVHRCLKRHLNEPPQFIENWYSTTLGISVSEAKDLLSLGSL